jgi:Bifunctional DNA primase/polymerase, N-terminal
MSQAADLPPRQSRQPTLNSALSWAAKGWPVLPCKPDKSPHVPRGKDEATTDPDQIRKWWSRWPYALVGGRTDGKVVLDFDAYKPGHSADRASLGELLPTCEHRTPGQEGVPGKHLIYLDPERVCRSTKLGPNGTIDIRAGTSRDYIILPSPGNGYAVVDPRDPAVMPGWLAEAVPSSRESADGPAEPLPDPEPLPAPLPARLRRALARSPEPTRLSEHTQFVAHEAARAGLSDGQTVSLLELDEVTQERASRDNRGHGKWKHDEYVRVIRVARQAQAEISSGRKPRGAQMKDRKGRSPASVRLLQIARQEYTFGRTTGEEPFAVRRSGPNTARMFGRGKSGLRAELEHTYEQIYGRPPGQKALSDAMGTLEGEALKQPPQDLPLRVARHGDELVLDLGGPDGRAVVISPGSWKVVDRSPVLFLRTPLVGELPTPVRGGKLARDLFPFLNVDRADWKLIGTVVLSYLWPDMTHPIAYPHGGEGTGKTTLTRRMRDLIDKSPVDVKRSPGREEDWEITIAGQWVVALNNLSSMPEWLSDAMCTTVERTGSTRRKLYTDNDLSVLSVRRVIIVNSIDATLANRGDFLDRAILFELEPITRFEDEEELDRAWGAAHPKALGALLDLAAKVLDKLPEVRAAGTGSSFRLVGFANLAAAVDRVAPGPSAFARYREKVAEGVSGALENDPLAKAVWELVRKKPFEGSASELWEKAVPVAARRPGANSLWPKDAHALGIRLRRIAGVLRKSGVVVVRRPGRTSGSVWTICQITDDDNQ